MANFVLKNVRLMYQGQLDLMKGVVGLALTKLQFLLSKRLQSVLFAICLAKGRRQGDVDGFWEDSRRPIQTGSFVRDI